ncbi:MAG: hypothetical protein EHM64_07715 [Ignavibacteriae bacterium]|nr:MAG: hypothetical protein EHM64_07715 [Ignavibacteriota bacterium]
MSHKIIILAFVLLSAGLAGCAAEQYSQTKKSHAMNVDSLRTMKISDVVALSKAGVSDSLIIGMMDATDTWFQLRTRDVLDLRNDGVSEKVISAMMQQPAQPAGKTTESSTVRYYVDPWFSWYDGFYPYGYYPAFSMRMGYRPHYFGFFHHGRFR